MQTNLRHPVHARLSIASIDHTGSASDGSHMIVYLLALLTIAIHGL